jgi:uncharacterized membrane-anchored protein YhcB (DUF1043 family)
MSKTELIAIGIGIGFIIGMWVGSVVFRLGQLYEIKRRDIE